MHVDSNSRSQYFEHVRKHAANDDLDYGELIGSDPFSTVLPYSNQTVNIQYINKKLFERVAQSQSCALNWLKFGVQVLSENEASLQVTAELLQPVLRLLRGTHIDLYWAYNLSRFKFRFRKPARFADHSLYNIKDFASTVLDLHLTRWDPKSLQDLTFKPTILGKIEYPAGTKNPWHKQKTFHYGKEENNPSQWINISTFSEILASKSRHPNRADQIHNWVEQIGNDVEDLVMDSQGSTAIPSRNSSKKTFETAIEEPSSEKQYRTMEQAKKTDIEERQQVQEVFNFDRPRVRPVPKLKAAHGSSSSVSTQESEDDAKIRLDFAGILLQHTAKLISKIGLFEYKTSCLTVDLGQLLVYSAAVPSMYLPEADLLQAPLRPEDWARVFFDSEENSTPAKSYFSPRLTSFTDDALYMSMTIWNLDKENEVPQSIFPNKPCSDRSSYRLCCRNRTSGTVASIVIDQKGNPTIESTSQDLGCVNIHFPGSIWDARISCTAKSALSEEDADALEQLLSTIWIGHGQDLPIEEETLYLRKEPRMTILSCQRYRERVHRTVEDLSDDNAIYLHITRIEDLRATDMSFAGEGAHAFTTVSNSNSQTNRYSDRHGQNLWFEAHLTSTAMDRLLPNPTDPSFLDRMKTTILSLEQDQDFHNSLREALVPLFDIAHKLVTKWDNIGSGDRVETARFGGGSFTTRSAAATDNNVCAGGDIFIAGNRVRGGNMR